MHEYITTCYDSSQRHSAVVASSATSTHHGSVTYRSIVVCVGSGWHLIVVVAACARMQIFSWVHLLTVLSACMTLFDCSFFVMNRLKEP
jgi:hypothetical protein